jgi:hypothetical protein
MGVTVAVLGALSLGLFIAFAVFFGKWNNLNAEKMAEQSVTEQFISTAERNRDDVNRQLANAKGERKSLVGYLLESQQAVMSRVTGVSGDTLPQLEQKVASLNAGGSPILTVARDQAARIAQLEEALAAADAERLKALTDKKTEVDRVATIEKSHTQTIAALNEQINQYKDEITRYREGTDGARKEMDVRIESLEDTIAKLRDESDRQRASMQEEILIQQAQVRSLRGERSKEIFQGSAEQSLVDAEVVGLNSADGSIIISIGRENKVTIGMSFSVYADAASIKPDDATGNYPRGKAGVEVIQVDNDTATCRVIWEARGNPIVKGDVVANPVYDPRKVYKMVVYGNYDVNNDGIATPEEADAVRAMIQSWGGEVLSAERGLTGDTDFLILGERPILPPEPSSGAPFEVVQNFIRLDEIVKRYDDLLEKARSTSLPVLNENRLYTLLGRDRPARR